MATSKPKLKPILGFWIFAVGRKPIYVIDANHTAALTYHFTASEVETVTRVLNICATERKNLTFALPMSVSIERVIAHTLAPPIAITKDVVTGERGWQHFCGRIGYDNQLTEEGSEKRVDIYDFARSEGEAALLLKPFVPVFELYSGDVSRRIGVNDEESE